MNSRIAAFVERVATLRPGRDSFNPWQAENADDLDNMNAAGARRSRLCQHLNCTDPVILCIGEAGGWRGLRVSGIPFTSERLISEGAIPRVAAIPRLTSRPLPLSEPSATVVWETLWRLGVAERTILWNAFPLHPHLRREPFTNRTPTSQELAAGLEVLVQLLDLFAGTLIFAIGHHASEALGRILPENAYTRVRHPSFGGATAFREAVCATLVSYGLARFQPQLALN